MVVLSRVMAMPWSPMVTHGNATVIRGQYVEIAIVICGNTWQCHGAVVAHGTAVFVVHEHAVAMPRSPMVTHGDATVIRGNVL